jgi:hypothetical protein
MNTRVKRRARRFLAAVAAGGLAAGLWAVAFRPAATANASPAGPTCIAGPMCTVSGYVAWNGSTPWGVSAEIQMPQITCPPGVTGGEAFWVGVQAPASGGLGGLVQPYVAMNCGDGQPTYYAGTVDPDGGMDPQLQLQQPVNPGDEIMLWVFSTAPGQWLQFIGDIEQNGGSWAQYVREYDSPVSPNLAAVAVESYSGGVDFGQVSVTVAQIDGIPIGQSDPYLYVQDPSIYQVSGASLPPELVPSALDGSGQDFQYTWDPGPPSGAPPASGYEVGGPPLP